MVARQLPEIFKPKRSENVRRRDLTRLAPWQIISLSLFISFLVFLLCHLLEQALAPDMMAEYRDLVLFVRGFIACASGMVLIYFIMSHKDSEIMRQRNVQLALLDEREDFLAVINHRLRNSLLATDRIVKLMLNGDFGKLEPTQQTILEHVSDNNNEIDRLIRMLVDIYDYRNGTKQIHPTDCNLSNLVKKVLEGKSSLAASKSVVLKSSVSQDSHAKAENREIESLINHLVENAIRHARSSVSVSCVKHDGNVVLSITDDGIGIPEADVQVLFDRFYVSSKNGKYPAVTGLGLCLCSQIAKAHGGALNCESHFGSGTTFSLTLPVA